VTSWSFLTSHARVLLRIARDPRASGATRRLPPAPSRSFRFGFLAPSPGRG